MADFWVIKETLTHDIVEDALVHLPPTPPEVYDMLSKRNEFKILYLVQGDYKQNIPAWYSEMEDKIYLSYKFNYEGNLKPD